MNRIKIIILKLTPNFILRRFLPFLNRFKFLIETKNTQTPITFDMWYQQKVRKTTQNANWPIHQTSKVYKPENIKCGIETSPGYSPGNYIQAMGKITIGDYTQIAPNVGIITANHSLYDNREHIIKNVEIGRYCWIGMGAIILPGVILGDYTIVAAGAIVTKSFDNGFVVIGGNPARILKKLNKKECIFHKSEYEYIGYNKKEK
ncbi:acyltransferase [Flammeovirga agarivorans]|uniref:Acyltransferase n=1 Tax=Flammeovirga agarivorans TaxID=2726742 RepID=A0A7X8XUN1_9BACT|nr:acyltransferase [Flammeovirga agarivorans]NLR90511.1 acyltransferase [Flammeovirga agarivorans]